MLESEAISMRVCSNQNCPLESQPQPLDEIHFAPNSRYAGGYKTRCRICERKTRRDRYYAKKAEEQSYNKAWIDTHRNERNAWQRSRYQHMIEAYRASRNV